MNWIERIAKILRDNTVRTVGKVGPTNGNVMPIAGGESLVVNGDFTRGTSKWTGNKAPTVTGEIDTDGSPMLHIVTSQYSSGVYQKTSTTKLHKGDKWCATGYIKGTGKITTLGVEYGVHSPEPELTESWTPFVTWGTANSDGPAIAIYAADSSDFYIKELMPTVGDLPRFYTPNPVTDVGGQYPVDGHIDMSGYALKADVTTLSDTLDGSNTNIKNLEQRIVLLESKNNGGTTE